MLRIASARAERLISRVIEFPFAAGEIIANANMGTGATAALINATDIAGVIYLDFGSAPWAAGAQATITFNRPYGNEAIIIISPADAAAAAAMALQRPYANSNGNTFILSFGAAATSGSVMRFFYYIIETVSN